jgi:ActD protein
MALDTPRKVYGMAAEFGSAQALFEAAEKIRDAGFKRWDVHSPFPIHGMDKAMGLGKSWLTAVIFCGGLTGFLFAFGLEVFPSTVLYKVVVMGKPVSFFSIPSWIPVMFELTILLSAFSAVFGLMAFIQLPKWYHPVFNWERFARTTDDGFFIVIEARDPKFSESKTRAFFEQLGGTHVTLIHD